MEKNLHSDNEKTFIESLENYEGKWDLLITLH